MGRMGWDGWDGMDGILLRSLVQLEHLAVLIKVHDRMGYTLDTGDTCMIFMISASFLINLCALCSSVNVYMCIVQCLTYIL